MRNTYNERELRLECIKLAATLVMQNKIGGGQSKVGELAQSFLEFVTAGDKP